MKRLSFTRLLAARRLAGEGVDNIIHAWVLLKERPEAEQTTHTRAALELMRSAVHGLSTFTTAADKALPGGDMPHACSPLLPEEKEAAYRDVLERVRYVAFIASRLRKSDPRVAAIVEELDVLRKKERS